MAISPPCERSLGAVGNYVYQRYSTASPGNSTTRFPIKAVIFDMLSFIQRTPSNAISLTDSTSATDGQRDLSNLIPTSACTSSCSGEVNASEVARSLGVYDPPELQNRILIEGKERLAKKQMMEEVMGRGDSVRAKYMEQIRAKKMMAQARRERERFSIDTNADASYPVQSTTPHKAWRLTPNSAALLLYLEERGIPQALIARGDQLQLNELLEELRNFKFKYLRNLEIDETEKSTSEVTNSANQ